MFDRGWGLLNPSARTGRRTGRIVALILAGSIRGLFAGGILGQEPVPAVFRHLKVPLAPQIPLAFFIEQDRLGFIWFCTRKGLVRYDGVSFRVFDHDPNNPDSLANSMVRTIRQAPDGRYWIGTHGGGLDEYDPVREKWTHHRAAAGDPNSLSNDFIWALAEDRDGSLWIGTEKGLNHFEPDRNRWTRYFCDTAAGSGQPSEVIYSLCIDRRGTIWAGTKTGGLYSFDPARTRWTHYLHDPANGNSISADNVPALMEDTEGRIWAGTINGLSRLDPLQKRWRVYKNDPRDPNSISGNVIIALLQDRRGAIWAGTIRNGLCRWEPGRDAWTSFKHDPRAAESLAQDSICNLLEDRGGLIWIGTISDGPDQFIPAANQWRLIRPVPDRPLDSAVNTVHCALRDRRGTLWLGTAQGLLGLDASGNRRVLYRHDPANPNSPSPGAVSALFQDRRGLIWVGFNRSGLNWFDPETRNWTRFAGTDNREDRFQGTNVQQFTEDRNGAIWIATADKDVSRFDPRTRTWTHFAVTERNPGSLLPGRCSSIFADHLGQIWVGTSNEGIARFDPDRRRWDRFEIDSNISPHNQPPLINFAEDAGGRLWACSQAVAPTTFDREKGRWAHYSDEIPWSGVTFGGLAADSSGRIWMATSEGLLGLEPGSRNFQRFDDRVFFPAGELMEGGVICAPDGEVLVCTDRGLVSFSSRRLVPNPPAPQVAITGWKFANGLQAVVPRSFRRGEAGKPVATLRGRYDALTLEFSFAVLDYALPGKNPTAYKLEGYDKDWISGPGLHAARYVNVRPGRYVFRVIGANSAGVWNWEGASLAVVIGLPFWKQAWFLGLILLTLLAAVLILFRRRVRLLVFFKGRATIGQYRLLRTLGSGGMATVYLARPILQKNRLVAVKVIREEFARDEVRRKRFRQEGAIIDQLDHPHIVKVFERGVHEDRFYIAMEYLPGITLAERLNAGDRLPADEWRDIMEQLSDVLVNIHKHGIIHRDLKPGNIMLLEKEGRRNFVKVLDFGVARQQLQSTVTEWGGLLGTIQYMAPEQISQSLYLPAGDVYALGMLGYEMLAGEHPFAGKSSAEMIRSILNDLPPDLTGRAHDVPPELGRLVMRMIAKDPAARPEAGELLAEFSRRPEAGTGKPL